LGICDIIDNENATCTLIVYFAERFVSLLPCSVPKSNFDVLITNLDYFGEKFNSDSRFLVFIELVADVSSGDVGFACAHGANDNNFEHFVIFIH